MPAKKTRKARPPKEQPNTVHASLLSRLRMVAGNEKKYPVVIDDGELKQWVGFGWVTEGVATPSDYRTYPTVVRD